MLRIRQLKTSEKRRKVSDEDKDEVRKKNCKIFGKHFLGALVADMKHYVKPTLEKNPEPIVLHVGTNDINEKKPRRNCQGSRISLYRYSDEQFS